VNGQASGPSPSLLTPDPSNFIAIPPSSFSSSACFQLLPASPPPHFFHSLSRSTKEKEEEEEEEEEEGRRSWGWEVKGGVMREEDSLSELDAGALLG